MGGDWEKTQTGIAADGDINADGEIGISDIIMTLQILTGENPDGVVCAGYTQSGVDVNDDGTKQTGDDRIGAEEALFTLMRMAETEN